MKPQPITHHTLVIERSYPTKPELLFSAFADSAKKRRWFAERGEAFEVEEFDAKFQTGGYERMRLRAKKGPLAGAVLASDANYQDIVLNQRVLLACTMSVGDRHVSTSLVSVEFLPIAKGTNLIFTEQAALLENAEAPQVREGKWRLLLDQLEKVSTQ